MSKSTHPRNDKGKRPARPTKAGPRKSGRPGPRPEREEEGAGSRSARPRPHSGPKRPGGGRPGGSRGPYKPAGDEEGTRSGGGRPYPRSGPNRPGTGRPGSGRGPYRPAGDEEGTRSGGGRPRSGPKRPGTGRPGGGRGPYRPAGDEEGARSGGGRSYPRSGPKRPGTGRPGGGRGPYKSTRPWQRSAEGEGREERSGRPGTRQGRPSSGAGPRKPWDAAKDRRQWKEDDPGARRPFRKGERSSRFSLPNPDNEGLIRLNKYLAQAGVGSRREADEFIAAGAVTVNGEVVTELGAKVKPTDTVHFGGQKLSIEQKRYVLLNKPKDTITTTDDPRERHTVMDLVAKASTERLYPVGRLDRNTTGVLLLTNDGDLAKKLTHPSHGAQKLYHATLDRNLTVEELQQLVEGVMLEDGPARADEASFVGSSRREVGLMIHMGRNRVVRRMFSALGAEVVKLDRVMFAGLTKKDLPRGRWRHLEEKEVVWLKQMKEAPKSTKAERGGRRTRLSPGSE